MVLLRDLFDQSVKLDLWHPFYRENMWKWAFGEGTDLSSTCSGTSSQAAGRASNSTNRRSSSSSR